ncbi:MAG TPA: pilus assembly protein TadG-related protein [Mycobacteriales bacterium]|nr:pilus assembly protein TadG-related protein [Mycobacteriales bacterium]
MSRRPRGEDGTVLLLTTFLGIVLVLFVVVVVDASAAFLARRSLAGAADGAAIAAAQHVDWDAYYAGNGDLLPLADAEAAVAAYVDAHYPGTDVVAVDSDGETVTVHLARPLRLPLAPPGFARDLTVTAEATARLARAP